MVDHAIGADWGAHIALSYDETWWALWEPLFLTLLTILAFLLLSVATPERQWLFAALLVLLEELGASEFFTIHRLNLLVGQGVFLLSATSLSPALLFRRLWVLSSTLLFAALATG